MNPELSYDTKPTSEEAVAPRSFFSRLNGVYFSPGETFVEMSKAPRALAPIIALTLLFVISSAFIASRGVTWEKIAVEQTQKALAAGRMSEEQSRQQIDGISKMAPVMNVIMPAIAAIWVIVMVFAFGGLAKLWSMMLGIDNKYMPLVSVTAYAMLAAYLVSTVILVILIFIKPIDEFDWANPIGSNLAAMFTALGVEGLPSFVKGLLSYVDVFYIWKVALIAIGCAAVSHKLKPSTAMVHAGIVACVLALIGGALAALGGA